MEVDGAAAYSGPTSAAPTEMLIDAAAPSTAQPGIDGDASANAAFVQPTIEQIRALVVAKFPAFATAACPAVAPGARWQLDLRTGERLEEQPVVVPFPIGSSAALAAAAQQAARPPIFTGGILPGYSYPGVPPLGFYPPPPGHQTLAGPAALSGPSLPHSAPGMQPQGPYTAMLAPVVPPGSMPAGDDAVPVPPKKRARAKKTSVGSGSGSDGGAVSTPVSLDSGSLPPEIPLRRRGRPAGDGNTATMDPIEQQERRMQANRAAASRSHFRRKREMEILEAEVALLQQRLAESSASCQALLVQEEQLRQQQIALREHLATGCKAE